MNQQGAGPGHGRDLRQHKTCIEVAGRKAATRQVKDGPAWNHLQPDRLYPPARNDSDHRRQLDTWRTLPPRHERRTASRLGVSDVNNGFIVDRNSTFSGCLPAPAELLG
jgi:hypothetical protein